MLKSGENKDLDDEIRSVYKFYFKVEFQGREVEVELKKKIAMN